MFKKYLIAILSTSLLLGCDFRPSTKVIEYQEEVKLSDGSMIWVDIKRHYRLAGEPFQKKNYLPSIVEISWDTGFPNVGRQSVFFDDRVYLIDKIDGAWYVVGYRYPYKGSREGINAVNCRDVGYLINRDYDCVFSMDKSGNFPKTNTPTYKLNDIQMNILNTTLLRNDGNPMKEFLDKSSLSWYDKLELQKTQPTDNRLIGRPLSYLVN